VVRIILLICTVFDQLNLGKVINLWDELSDLKAKCLPVLHYTLLKLVH